MLGTTKVRGFASDSSDVMPSAVLSVLDQIRNHPTKASTSYYVKYFERYFEGMLASLKEIRRVCAADSPGLFVVQDSFYKDIHIDLQQLLVEIAESCGWAADSRHDFPVPRTLAASNPRSRKYRTNHKATESVIQLRAA